MCTVGLRRANTGSDELNQQRGVDACFQGSFVGGIDHVEW